MAEAIQGARVILHKRASDAQTLYGSVTATEIADALRKQGLDIDRRRIDLEGGIKTVGDHHIEVHLHADVDAELVVTVLPEE